MRKTWVIALREYNAAVRTRTFLISLILMPVMMGGSIFVQVLLKESDLREKTVAVLDQSPKGQIGQAIEKAFEAYNKHAIYDPDTGKQTLPRYQIELVTLPDHSAETLARERSALEARMRQGKLLGFLEIGQDVMETSSSPTEALAAHRSVIFETNRVAGLEFRKQIEAIINEAVQSERGKKLGLDDAKRKAILQPVPMVLKVQAPFAVPFIMVIMMFLVLMMVANPLMQGVIEEKMNRIAEVLLGSVTPFQLMMGKLLGMTAVSLTIVTVYVVGTLGGAYYYGFGDYIPPAGMLVWFFVFQTLAALMYGSLFSAIGAACSEMKEAQNLVLPVMLICCVPLFLLNNLIREPNSPVVAAASFFPLATPMLMVARQAIPPGIPLWQPLLGVVLVLATTVFCVWAAGRVFRIGLLAQGKGANLAEMARWVFSG
jgi:ABC-2 type transport system permease protein